jgi:hypothetical protein
MWCSKYVNTTALLSTQPANEQHISNFQRMAGTSFPFLSDPSLVLLHHSTRFSDFVVPARLPPKQLSSFNLKHPGFDRPRVDDSTHADTIGVELCSTFAPDGALCTLHSNPRAVECNFTFNFEVSSSRERRECDRV